MKIPILFKCLLLCIIALNSTQTGWASTPSLIKLQQNGVTGKVTDEQGIGLFGATISVKNTSIGTITDENGEFKIDNLKKDSVLMVSYVGFITQEVKVNDDSNLIIVLKQNVENLDEVVIVGYGTATRSDLTSSVASYKLQENDGKQFTSVANLIQGRMPGVVVSNNSFQPGAAASIRIRGANSLRNDNEPLYVIDNVPLYSSTLDNADAFGGSGGSYATPQDALATISPSDIERIEVLKDAASTAIYGSRGANGVILITTKKGTSSGKPTWSFETNMTTATITKRLNLMDLDEYALFRNEMSGRGNEQFARTDTISGLTSPTGYIYIPSRTEYNPAVDTTYLKIKEAVDWQKELFNPAIQYNHRVSVRGGNKDARYYISGGFQSVSGLVQGAGLKQGNMNLNFDVTPNSKTKIGFTLSAVSRKNNLQQNGNRFGASTTGSALRAALSGNPYILQQREDSNLTEDEFLEEEGVTSIFGWIKDYKDVSQEYAFRSGLNISYNIWDDITYELRLGGNYRWKERSRWFGPRTFRGGQENGALAISTLTAYTYVVENLLRYNKSMSKNFKIDALLGSTLDQQFIKNELKNASGFGIKTLEEDGFHLAQTVNVLNPVQSDFSILSFLGRANVNLYEGKYIVSGIIRADGSSKFPSKKWGYFPSASIAWNIGREPFIKGSSFINELKLKAGWGITGNQNIAAFSTLVNYTSGTNYSDNGNNTTLGLTVNNIANEDLTWETTESTNLGLDFGLIKNRISGTVEVYKKTTRDLLNLKSIPTSSGFSSLLVNRGSLENKGIEVSISATVIENDKFRWSVGGNIAFNKGKVIDLGLEPAQFGSEEFSAFTGNLVTGGVVLPYPANIFIEGKEPALFWGYKTDGILQETDANVDYGSVGVNEPGEIKFIDNNGDGLIDENDLTFIGNPNPDYTYGLTSEFEYEGLSMKLFFIGSQGNDIINAGSYFLNYPGAYGTQSNALSDAYINAWRPDNPSTTHVKLGSNAPRVLADRYVEDASYLRLAELTLAYRFPKDVVKSIGLNGLALNFTGNNLFTITNYKGFDPAANSFAFDGLRQGIDFNEFPNVRSFSLGINLSL